MNDGMRSFKLSYVDVQVHHFKVNSGWMKVKITPVACLKSYLT